MKTLVAISVLVCCHGAGVAGEATYKPRHRSADELARLVRQVVPVEINVADKHLVLRGADDLLIQANQFLHRLDRTPRKYAIRILVAQFAPGSMSDEAGSLTGTFEQVANKLGTLRKQGRVLDLKQHQLTVTDGHPAGPNDGPEKTPAKKRRGFGAGPARTLETRIVATPRGIDIKRVEVELSIRDARPGPIADNAAGDNAAGDNAAGDNAAGDNAAGGANDQPRGEALYLSEQINVAFTVRPDEVKVIRGIAGAGRPRLIVVVAVRPTE
jgi:hypothetical protein